MAARGSLEIESQLVDIFERRIYLAKVIISDGKIVKINALKTGVNDTDFIAKHPFILPGFIDSHIHIESSMLTPYEFARKALIHGTVATVSDPHEIANVCGLQGVYYMLENAKNAKLKIHFGAPSCVPATAFETAGAILNAEHTETLLQRDDIYYLSEMMNYPGVLFDDSEVLEKIKLAKKYNKPVDGHAPGLTGDDAIKYINAGITTDHECYTYDEALHKIKNGMKILIREGSAAKNFEALHKLISEYPDQVMFCSDDKHPDELMSGHINLVVKRALEKGHDLFDVLQCACVNPVLQYKLNVGILREGDPADFIMVDNLSDFNLLKTYIDGECVVNNGSCILENKKHALLNNFSVDPKNFIDFALPVKGNKIKVIEAIEGQLITRSLETNIKAENGFAVSDTTGDILKITVVNRYRDEPPSVAFIKNFNLKSGAIASTVAHDSHNIIAVGVDDESICRAVNLLIKYKGGLSAVNGSIEYVLPLPIAGLMSDMTCEKTAVAYTELNEIVKDMGCTMHAPFMTLSFMALLVIPELKLSDKGLFNGKFFQLTEVFI